MLPRALTWFVFLCALWFSLAPDARAMDLRLRVAWGGGVARQWQGSLSVEFGNLSQLSYLGLDADESATIFLDGNSVQLQQRAARDYDGFDIQVRGSGQTTLTLEIAPVGSPQELQRIEVTLEELVSGYRHAELDTQNNQILIQRVSGDQLRTKFERSSLVFSPGETFDFDVIPNETGLDDLSHLRYQIELFRPGEDAQLWEQSDELTETASGELNSIGPVAIPLPEAEGVYQVVISVLRKRFRDTFVRSKPLLQRQIQLVVVSNESTEPGNESWKLLESIDPNQASWMEWLSRVPRLPLLPDFRHGPLANEEPKARQHLGQELVVLAPGGWQAYPLSSDAIGKPHLLEVEYPSDIVQTLGISLIEPNAVGQVAPLQLDSGVDVTEESASESGRMLRHRLLFWPRTSAPLVLLTNRQSDRPAVFGKIRIYAGPDRLAAAERPAPLASPRLLAAYFDRPLFPENFTAPESADQWSGRSLKDWLTFYEGGKRLVDYLKHVGYNGAIISVACQGGSIYPSELLNPIPKYDTGTFFASGQDPVRKDILEMLFRLFDREGLALVPAVHFSSTLDELEQALRSQTTDPEGIALVDRQGNRYQVGSGQQGMGPHYNPLDNRVQAAMRRVLNEISDRYSQHSSFAGLSLQLGPDTYALLPGEHWGYDRVTLKRFENESNFTSDSSSQSPLAEIQTRDRRRTWLEWRASVLQKFYRDILADLQQRRPDAKLYLAGGDIFVNPNLKNMLQPSIPNRLRIDEALLQLGIVTRHFQNQNQIILFRPERMAPRTPLTKQAININLATNSAADHVFGEIEPAASLFYHERLTLALPSFDAKSPFGPDNTSARLFTHVTPSGESNRQRFVHHLALRDVQYFADGGWMIPLGQEDSLRPLLQTLTQLPARKFETIHPKSTTLPTQPLVVRSTVHDGKTYVYVVNDSPWAVTAEIDIESPQPCELQAIGGRTLAQPTWVDRQSTWALDLEPFDVVAAVFPSDKATVATWRVSVDRATYAELRRQVEQLKIRTLKLGNPDPIRVLSNPSFEGATDRLPGWIHNQGNGIVIGPDTSSSFEGQQSLKILNQSQAVAWVRSDPFDPPPTGRIAVVVRLRTDTPDDQPPLRLSIEGKYLDGKPLYKPFNVGRHSKAAPISKDWGANPYVLLINDLPSNQLANIRVGFDLMGPGNVWIDDVLVYDRWFPRHEQNDLMIMRGLAARSLSMGRISDCRQILQGYWSQFLMEHFSAEVAQVAEVPAATKGGGAAFPPPQSTPKPDPPSVLDKMKGLPTKVFQFKLR